MEPILSRGDYLPDHLGGIRTCDGNEALLQRVLFRLVARRGQFPLLPSLGSRLYLLGQEAPSHRRNAARLYVAEALEEEPVTLRSVDLSAGEDSHMALSVLLDAAGDTLSLSLTL